ncbi:TonB-dependent receptor [Vibrio sinensis]|uniref:TonB-dependent receptor n=1 Tax=Vibrio sinensis TaxID=2302434 RepID=A0A3A6Q9C8_9VIBR|nr:TonB-dependent receptor [Vibrio sinensis]RJX68429.1 TonB-dependent receptor [Vibrio sinensis]
MPTLYRTQSLVFALATTLAYPALAQDDLFDASLEDLLATEVVGVSKTKQLISEAPANVTVITAEDIARYGYQTVAEAISRLPGVAITRDNTYSYGGVRGMTSDAANYNSRFLLMINGHRINDGLYDQALVGHESIIDIHAIDRIEFIKGPGAIMYGGNALYGVINILTRSGRQIDGTELRMAAASNEGYSVSQISGGETDSGLQWTAQVSHTEESKHDESNLYGDYSARGRHTKAMGQLNGDNFNITMMLAEHQLQNSEVWTYQGDYYVSDIPETTRQLMLGGEYIWKIGHKTHITALGNISRFHDDFSRYDFGELWYRDVSNSDWISGELRLGSEAIEGQRWTMGIEWRRDLPLDNKYWYEPLENPTDVYFLDVDRTSVGGYIQGEFSLATDWMVVAGGRIDKIEYFDAEFSPRLSVIWTPTVSSTLKLIHSEAFRTPSAIEFGYGAEANYFGEKLTPEHMKSQELIYEYRQGALLTSVAIYHNQLEDGIGENIDAGYINTSTLTSQGIELAFNYRHNSGLGGYANYSYQDTSSKDNTPVMNSPENLIKVGIDGSWFENRLTSALEWQYTSEREVASESPKADAYHLVNLYMTMRPWNKGPELSFKAINVMDDDYGVSAYSFEFPGRSRELWFGITQVW